MLKLCRYSLLVWLTILPVLFTFIRIFKRREERRTCAFADNATTCPMMFIITSPFNFYVMCARVCACAYSEERSTLL